MPDDKKTNHPVHHLADGERVADGERGPIGVGSEATEGIHDVDMKGMHQRTGLEHRTPGLQAGAEPLRERGWNHESGYGGKGGKPKTSSDSREAGEKNAVPKSASEPPQARKGK